MLYLVNMIVTPPTHLSDEEWAELCIKERDYAQVAMRDGRLLRIWRVVGEYANYSVFDVESHDELHTLISGLPLFPYIEATVIPLATHPSALEGM